MPEAAPLAPAPLAIFTTGSRNRLAMAGALMATARRWHPEAALYIALGDDPTGAIPPPGVTLVDGASLGVPDWPRHCFIHDAMALNCVLKPFMFRHLLAERGYRQVLHFDTDIALFAPLDSVLTALDAGAALVLTPHLLAPPAPGDTPDARAILLAGTYNSGFVAAADTPSAHAALAWWSDRVLEECRPAPELGLLWDQRWVDLIPGLFPNIHISRDPSLNVAYWNLAQRRLDHESDHFTVNDQPLGFFHFSGFNPHTPNRLTRHPSSLPASPATTALLAWYATLLAAQGPEDPTPYAFARFASGTPIPPFARACFRTLDHAWPENPFASFEAHLNTRHPGTPLHPAGYVATNLIVALVQADPVLSALIDLTTEEGVRTAIHWAANAALADAAIPDSFLAPAIANLTPAERKTLPTTRLPLNRLLESLHHSDATRDLAAMTQSTSWRLTAPLRKMADLVRGKKKGR